MKNSCGPNSESQRTMMVEQMENQGILDIESSPTKVDQVNKELLEEAGQKNASWNSEEECHDEDIYTGISL